MKSLDLFLPKIHQFAPEASDPMAFEWLREAAITFCERTRAWRGDDSYAVTDTQPMSVIAPRGAVIHEIDMVKFNDIELTRKTPAELDALAPGWRDGSVRGLPRWFTQTTPDTIALAPLGGGRINAYLSLKPAPDSEEVPDFIAAQYRQVIADGALARILMLPKQPFTNEAQAAAFHALFNERLKDLSTKGSSGQQRAHPTTKPSMF